MSDGRKSTWSLGFRRYLVAGLLLWLPILATVSVVSFMLQVMNSILELVPENLRPKEFLGFALPTQALPLLGAVVALLIVLMTGVMVTNFIGRRLVFWGEFLLQRIPLVGSVYGGVKSFAESVFSQSNAFRQVVMVQYPRKGLWSIGFLTNESIPEISAKAGAPHVCVFVSTALNATSGHLIMVPREEVVALDMTIDAAMKMVITCGVVAPQLGELPEKPARVLEGTA